MIIAMHSLASILSMKLSIVSVRSITMVMKLALPRYVATSLGAESLPSL